MQNSSTNLAGEVPMEDAFGMKVLHAEGHVLGQRDAHNMRQVHAPVLDQLLQRAAVDVLGERVQLALVHADAHEAQNVRMRQLVHQLHLLQHVAPVRAQLVHLQHHHGPRGLLRHLVQEKQQFSHDYCGQYKTLHDVQ